MREVRHQHLAALGAGTETGGDALFADVHADSDLLAAAGFGRALERLSAAQCGERAREREHQSFGTSRGRGAVRAGDVAR
jgi:hypothetical protein